MKGILGFVMIFGFLMFFIQANPTNKITIDQLDDYNLLQIFDHLDINGLVILADTNPGFHQLIIDHYMIPIYRIHEKTIHFKLASPRDIRGRLVVTNYETILLFLRNFGHLATSIEFSTSPVSIFKSIEQYCSDTLGELVLDIAKPTINDTNKIFKKVTKLKLKYYWVESDFSAIDKIFPALEELTIQIPHPLQSDLARFFPNLKRLHVIEENLKAFAVGGIQKFIQTNPQLRALSLGRLASYELLRYISETATNLEELSIKYCSNVISRYDEVVHFDQIKKLKIESVRYRQEESNQIMISFPQLESLEITAKYVFLIPTELIRQHNVGLKYLTFTQTIGSLGRYADFLTKAGPFEALEEIEMNWENSTGVERLMTEFETLQRITFIWHQRAGEQLVLDELMSKLQGNWLLSEYYPIAPSAHYDFYNVVISRYD